MTSPAMDSAAPFLEARGFGGGGGRPIPHDARAYMFKFLIDEIRKQYVLTARAKVEETTGS